MTEIAPRYICIYHGLEDEETFEVDLAFIDSLYTASAVGSKSSAMHGDN